MRICDLREKQVINSRDCKVLGCTSDVDFDLKTGCIRAIIVPGPGRFWGFLGCDCEYVIPYDCISNIGPDVILVNVCEEKIITKL